MDFHIGSGIVTGRSHLAYGINCQDAVSKSVVEHNGQTYYVGVVSDGCGEGAKTEVGASLAVAVATVKVESLIKSGVAVKRIPNILYAQLVEYFRGLVMGFETKDMPPEVVVEFIKDHLLFTLVGFISGPENTVAFASGDGVVVINDRVDIRDENNKPHYLSYHLIDRKYLKTEGTTLPKGFDIYDVKTADLVRLAVGTDSWKDELLALLELVGDNYPSAQRRMNVLSQKEKHFSDDASIVVLKKM
jgi:hypothetical protein